MTADAFQEFLEKTGLRDRIAKLLVGLDPNNLEEIEEVSERIRSLILSTPMPEEMEKGIREAYRKLEEKTGIKGVLVAVRSSATTEDLPEASFAGQQDTYLNVSGEEDVVEKVKRVWASLYTARAITYRAEKGIPHEKVTMAVIVQKMVNARSAGVMFTLHPVTGDPNVVFIESSWGLGEAVAGGHVTPDEFVVDKKTLRIIDVKINEKRIAIVYDPKERRNKEIELPLEKALAPSLSEREVLALAKYAILVEEHYGRPMDIEWAIDADLEYPENIFILQARPETVWSRKRGLEVVKPREEEKVLVRGIPASPGVAAGEARVILDPHSPEASLFREGDVLVTRMTDPDWVPLMRKAAAIVTDEGGMTSHAAIVSRELGKPAVVGTKEATKKIKTGMTVTVDGSRGVVYEGLVEKVLEKARPSTTVIAKPGEKAEMAVAPLLPREVVQEIYPVTATKIYMNLGEPEAIERYLDLPFDGIGLMRIEFIISDWVGYHPLYLLNTGRAELFVDKLAEGIARVA